MSAAMNRVRQAVRRVASRQEGFTLIELMVAILILVVGLLSIASTFSQSGALTNLSEKTEAATYQGQKEMERLKTLSYNKLAVGASTVLGGPAASVRDPLHCWFGTAGTGGTYDWNPTSCSSASSTAETLVTSASAVAPSGPVAFQSTWQDTGYSGGPSVRLSGKIYRFVTFVKNDPQCGASCYSSCASSPTTCYKRITLAITLDKGPPNKPIILSSFVKPRLPADQNVLDAAGTTCQDDQAGNVAVPC